MARIMLVVLLAIAAADAARAVEIEGNRNLPPCNWHRRLPHDCHITGPDMAINMMTNPPDRQTQPNAYYEYKQYERERERNSVSGGRD
jgi:hypothetical protein